MSAYRYSSPRDALRAYYVGRRGPRASRPRYEPRTSTRSYGAPNNAWVTVGRMLHSSADDGGCGVERDSALARAVWRWTEGIGDRTPEVRAVEIRLRAALRAAGLMRPAVAVPSTIATPESTPTHTDCLRPVPNTCTK